MKATHPVNVHNVNAASLLSAHLWCIFHHLCLFVSLPVLKDLCEKMTGLVAEERLLSGPRLWSFSLSLSRAAGENHSITLIIIILRWLMHMLSSFFLGITSEFRLCLLCGCSLRLFRICYKTKRCCYTAQTTEHGTGSVHLSKRGRRFQVEGCKMSVLSQSSPILESRPVAVRMPRWRTHLLLLYFKIHTLASY